MSFLKRRRHIIIWTLLGCTAIFVMSIFSATLGAADLQFKDALRILLAQLPLLKNHIDLSNLPNPMYPTIVLNLRLPRIVLAVMVGGLLASSGTVYQSIFRNPMADPFVLGISSGAALGAALAMVLGFNIGALGLSSIAIAAFVGAVVTTLVVYRIATTGKTTPVLTLVLTGIATSFFLSAMLSLLIAFNREQMEQIIFWMYGSLATASWQEVLVVLPIYIVSTVMLIIKGRTLNVMTLGEDSASTLGVDVAKERMIILLTASLATAAAVAVTGIIGFVGLVVPHVLRLITGPDNRSLLPFSMLLGGGFMMVCDAIARTVVAPTEVPIGIITSLLGAPYFIYLIVKSKRRGGLT